MTPETVTPTLRACLMAMHHAPDNALVRVRGGFRAVRSHNGHWPVFTLRAVRMLDRDLLVEFDNPAFPTIVTLTTRGVGLAAALAKRYEKDAAA